MRTLIIVGAMAALAAPCVSVAAPSGGFRIDDIVPGEGAESDCYTVFRRPETKSVNGEPNPRNMFEIVGEIGFIKIDGTMHALQLAKGGKPPTYRDEAISVIDLTNVVRIVKAEDGDTYYLKGRVKISYRGQMQILNVLGESYCYSG